MHYSHICAVIGCPFAPIKKLQELARQYRCFISALPLLTKDNKTEITKVFNNIKDEYLSEHELSYSTRRISSLCNSERLQPYKKLKEDNDRLKADIGYLKKEETKYKKCFIENGILRDKREKAVRKLELIIKKISKGE